MDLGEVLDATEPVECEFLSHTITAYVYTAGAMRLTKEQRAVLRTVGQTVDVETSDSETDNEQISLQVSEQIYNKNIDTARLLIPIMVHSWHLDGSEMTYRNEPLPPVMENMPRCPDALVMEVALKAVDVWNRPTNGGPQPNGSPVAALPGQSQTGNTTP